MTDNRNNRYRKAAVLVLAAALLAGCGSEGTDSSKLPKNNAVDQVIQDQVAAEDAATDASGADDGKDAADAAKEDAAKETAGSASSPHENQEALKQAYQMDVDVDLTTMNSDMIYATVYEMMTEPENYEGKKIRLAGNYQVTFYDATQQYYHYALIQDAAACCAQGLEFVWDDGSHVYPDEYPEDYDDILVVGTFETYTEEGDENLYCHLKDATLVPMT